MKKRLLVCGILMWMCYAITYSQKENSLIEPDMSRLEFLNELKQEQVLISDIKRPYLVVNNSFFKEKTSSAHLYILIFNYLLGHTTEEFCEGIGFDFYKMFTSYPEKFEEFDRYLQFLNEKDKERVLGKLCDYVLFEYVYEVRCLQDKSVILPPPTVEDFKKRFPYLYERGCTKYFIETLKRGI